MSLPVGGAPTAPMGDKAPPPALEVSLVGGVAPTPRVGGVIEPLTPPTACAVGAEGSARSTTASVSRVVLVRPAAPPNTLSPTLYGQSFSPLPNKPLLPLAPGSSSYAAVVKKPVAASSSLAKGKGKGKAEAQDAGAGAAARRCCLRRLPALRPVLRGRHVKQHASSGKSHARKRRKIGLLPNKAIV